MDWNIVGTIVAAAVGGVIALAGTFGLQRKQRRTAEVDEARTAAREFITWLAAFLLTAEREGLDATNDIEIAGPLLQSITRFRLSPVLDEKTLVAGERFHNAVNAAAHHPPATEDEKQRSAWERYLLQVRLEELVRNDLGSPLAPGAWEMRLQRDDESGSESAGPHE